MNMLSQGRLGPINQQSWVTLSTTKTLRPAGRYLSSWKTPCNQGLSTYSNHGRSAACKSTEAAMAGAPMSCNIPCKSSIAAAAAIGAPAVPMLSDAVIYTVVASTAYTALCFIGMVLFPRKSAGIFSSAWPFIPLVLAYLLLLVLSWSPDTLQIMMPGSLKEGLSGGFNPQFFPRLEGISTLFGRLGVTASWMLHVLVINLFAGRWCLLEGLRQGIPTAHSVLLCSVFGPLGLLSHFATKALSTAIPALKEEAVVTLKSEQGTITILPYAGNS
ncbi:hypothetical protein Vretimale_2460 [Volvox reticuliferus]|uniref:Uncharacterized protein n=1 Tax=Volvox reticuliferus TaxID=1737510 RepID=A0A8J4FG33_9CHLO|nr:hypothetical protein Vretifemale_4744 [Volvox reticuliferus]GIL96697.1 hypothetical protein Vretimale_2460 [Volvox reticuliferus]